MKATSKQVGVSVGLVARQENLHHSNPSLLLRCQRLVAQQQLEMKSRSPMALSSGRLSLHLPQWALLSLRMIKWTLNLRPALLLLLLRLPL
jgi:hypothetical protein